MKFDEIMELYREKRRKNNVGFEEIFDSPKVIREGKYYITVELETLNRIFSSVIDVFKELSDGEVKP